MGTGGPGASMRGMVFLSTNTVAGLKCSVMIGVDANTFSKL